MKKILITIALVLCYPYLSNCQTNHNVWYGQFEVRGNSLLLPTCAGLVNSIPNAIIGGQVGAEMGEEAYLKGEELTIEDYLDGDFWDEVNRRLYDYNKWLRVSPSYDIHAPRWSLDIADDQMALQGPDWWRCLLFGDFKHNYNCSVGYSMGWRSNVIPFGAKIALNYEWRGVCVTEGDLTGLHRTSGIVPSFIWDWLILGNAVERRSGWNLIVESGVSYVKNLTYNDPLQLGKTAVNDVIRVIQGFGFKYGTWLCSIRYEGDCNNYFNLPDTRTNLNSFVLSFGSMF